MPIQYNTAMYSTPREAIEEIVDRSGTFVEQVVGGQVNRDNVDEYVESVWPDMVDAYGEESEGDGELTEDDLRSYMLTLLDEEERTSLRIDGEGQYDEAEAAEQDRLDAHAMNDLDHRP